MTPISHREIINDDKVLLALSCQPRGFFSTHFYFLPTKLKETWRDDYSYTSLLDVFVSPALVYYFSLSLSCLDTAGLTLATGAPHRLISLIRRLFDLSVCVCVCVCVCVRESLNADDLNGNVSAWERFLFLAHVLTSTSSPRTETIFFLFFYIPVSGGCHSMWATFLPPCSYLTSNIHPPTHTHTHTLHITVQHVSAALHRFTSRLCPRVFFTRVPRLATHRCVFAVLLSQGAWGVCVGCCLVAAWSCGVSLPGLP